MLGAIIGDIVGSVYEWDNIKTKDFELMPDRCFFTDDTVMTLAICDALMKSREDRSDFEQHAVQSMREIGPKYPDAGYGGRFGGWLYVKDPQPYNSWGNGSAMRVSGCGWAAGSIDEAISLGRASAAVTHNHPEGIKGAEAVAVAIYMARTGSSMDEIRDCMKRYYALDFTLDGIRASYRFNESCQETVPQAIEAFLESTSFEDAIRNAISLGGDSDTLAAITGSIAEAYYGIPEDLREKTLTFLDERLTKILNEFENRYGIR